MGTVYRLISPQQEDSAVESPEGSWVLARWMRTWESVRTVLEALLLPLVLPLTQSRSRRMTQCLDHTGLLRESRDAPGTSILSPLPRVRLFHHTDSCSSISQWWCSKIYTKFNLNFSI